MYPVKTKPTPTRPPGTLNSLRRGKRTTPAFPKPKTQKTFNLAKKLCVSAYGFAVLYALIEGGYSLYHADAGMTILCCLAACVSLFVAFLIINDKSDNESI